MLGGGGSTPAAFAQRFGSRRRLVELSGTPPFGHLPPLAHTRKCLQATKKKHIASSLRDLLREGMQMLTHAFAPGR